MRQDRCGGQLVVGKLVRTGCKKISGLMECTCDWDLESDLGLAPRHADEQSESALAAIRHHADGVSRVQRAILRLSIGFMGDLGWWVRRAGDGENLQNFSNKLGVHGTGRLALRRTVGAAPFVASSSLRIWSRMMTFSLCAKL